MKKNVVEELRQAQGMTENEAQHAYEAVVHAMSASLRKHGELRIAPIGTIKKGYRQGRTGRNPATGESITIPGKDVLKFKAAKGAI